MSVLMIRPFFTQSTMQFDQSLVVTVGTRYELLIVDDTLLITPNSQHRLPSEETHDYLRLGLTKYIGFSSSFIIR